MLFKTCKVELDARNGKVIQLSTKGEAAGKKTKLQNAMLADGTSKMWQKEEISVMKKKKHRLAGGGTIRGYLRSNLFEKLSNLFA